MTRLSPLIMSLKSLLYLSHEGSPQRYMPIINFVEVSQQIWYKKTTNLYSIIYYQFNDLELDLGV